MSSKDCVTCIHRRCCYDYVCCYWALHYPRPNAEKCEDYSKEDYNPEEEK